MSEELDKTDAGIFVSIQANTSDSIVSTQIPANTGESRNPDGTFKKGVSGNPAGKPEGSFSLIAMLKAELQKCPEGQDKKTFADMLIQRIMKKAISDGDDSQIRNILQYVEGMPKQKLEMSGTIDTRLEVLTRMGLNDSKVKRIEEQTSQTS